MEMATYYEGKRLEDMTREELIDAVKHLGKLEAQWRKDYFEVVKREADHFKRLRDQIHENDAAWASFAVD